MYIACLCTWQWIKYRHPPISLEKEGAVEGEGMLVCACIYVCERERCCACVCARVCCVRASCGRVSFGEEGERFDFVS